MDYSKKVTIRNKATKEVKRITLFEALAIEDENWTIVRKKVMNKRARNKYFSKAVAINWTIVTEEHSVNNKVKGSVKTKFVTVNKLKMYSRDFGTAIQKHRAVSGNNSKSTRGRMRQVVSVHKNIEGDGLVYQIITKRKRSIIHVKQ